MLRVCGAEAPAERAIHAAITFYIRMTSQWCRWHSSAAPCVARELGEQPNRQSRQARRRAPCRLEAAQERTSHCEKSILELRCAAARCGLRGRSLSRAVKPMLQGLSRGASAARRRRPRCRQGIGRGTESKWRVGGVRAIRTRSVRLDARVARDLARSKTRDRCPSSHIGRTPLGRIAGHRVPRTARFNFRVAVRSQAALARPHW